MKQVVYVDVLIIENFFMNFLLIYIVNRFCRCKAKLWRMIAAALMGALYVLVLFFPDLHLFYTMMMKVAISALMLIISFSPRTLKYFLKLVFMFYIEAFTIGGCILGIFYLNRYKSGISDSFLFIIDMPPEYIIMGSIIGIIMIKFGFDFYENYYLTRQSKIELEIILEGRKSRVVALIDTGNSLKDPITNIPVIIAYYKSLIEMLPDDIKDVAYMQEDYEIIKKTFLNSELKSRIRIIPFRAIGTENGLLVGIRVDMIISRFNHKMNVIEKPIVALSDHPVSNSDEYQALAYPEIIKGVNK